MLSKEELEKKVATYVGKEIGPPEEAMEPINESMIFHWCEALGDNNPVYSEEWGTCGYFDDGYASCSLRGDDRTVEA